MWFRDSMGQWEKSREEDNTDKVKPIAATTPRIEVADNDSRYKMTPSSFLKQSLDQSE